VKRPDQQTRRSAWLKLIRAPNLLTVPGDPIAGTLLALSLSRTSVPDGGILYVVMASLAFYVIGVVLNDVMDLPRDRKQRPERPLVQKRISKDHALLACTLLSIAGIILLACAGTLALLVGLVLLLLVFGYNLALKKTYWGGSISMGLCRGINFLLGASIVSLTALPVWVVAAGVTAYIATVTAFAKQENVAGAVSRTYLLTIWPVATFALAIVFSAPGGHLTAPAILAALLPLSILTVFTALMASKLASAFATPADKQTIIGNLLRMLLFWQATYVLLSGLPFSWVPALILVTAYPAHAAISRKYTAS